MGIRSSWRRPRPSATRCSTARSWPSSTAFRPSNGCSRACTCGALRRSRAATDCPVTFVVFDVLRRFGVELTARPYAERRATLERFAAEHDGWTLSPSFDDGPATESVARQHGLEGVVAKRLRSVYRPGVRSDDWRKLRFSRAGDFAVIGWEGAADTPSMLSSLVLAVVRDGGLSYAGRVGSGLTAAMSTRLAKQLVPRRDPAVAGVPPPLNRRQLRWVEPEVVVEVEFAAWTGDGRLRHPVLRGVRADKTVEEAHGDG